MKNLSIASAFFLALLLTISIISCKKDDKNKIPSDKVAGIGTVAATLETNSTVWCSGLVGADNGYTVTTRGFCWSSVNNTPTIADDTVVVGAGSGAFQDTIVGLKASTRYYVRAYATNAAGTSYGSTMSFVTKEASLGTINILEITNIDSTSATMKVQIVSTGGADIIEKGICFGLNEDPLITTNKVTSNSTDWVFSVNLNNLKSKTSYYCRAFLTNSKGTTYSNNIAFRTFHYDGQVTDIEGHVYPTIKIKNKMWMAANLRVSKLNDGTKINKVEDLWEWSSTSSPVYCYYYNDSVHYSSIGILYNYYVVATGKLAPTGWHVATYQEYVDLLTALSIDFNGNNAAVASALYLTGSNSTGFSGGEEALRRGDGLFGNAPSYAETYYWAFKATGSLATLATLALLNGVPPTGDYRAEMDSFQGPNWGLFVRCVKD